MKIILASESKRRKDLLKLLNFDFITIAANIDESKIFNLNLKPEEACTELAFLKAKKVSLKNNDKIVIGGDTIVVVGNEVLGKPSDKVSAFKMLNKLSNKTHEVITGISIQYKNKDIVSNFHEKTYVTFNKLNNDDINYYINNNHPYDKAGSYGIQDWSSIFVKKIEGCFYNVVGFPISKFYFNFKKLELNKFIKTF